MRKLTHKQQLIILKVCCEDLRAAKIAEDLGVNIKTIEAHLAAIYKNCGIKRRSQLFYLFYSGDILKFC